MPTPRAVQVGAGIKPVSIVSYNHLGNNDGCNLSAPQTFRSKVSACTDLQLTWVCKQVSLVCTQLISIKPTSTFTSCIFAIFGKLQYMWRIRWVHVDWAKHFKALMKEMGLERLGGLACTNAHCSAPVTIELCTAAFTKKSTAR
jgi:hypothetical protein